MIARPISRGLTRVLALLLATAALPWMPGAEGAAEDGGETFTVMAYNVEMLFDVDGVAAIEEYRPPHWGPVQLDRKLAGISRVLQRVDGGTGRGPDIICFNELEADQTRDDPAAAVAVAELFGGRTTTDLLNASALDPRLAALPVEVWLAQRLAEDGLPHYHVAVGRWREDPTERVVFHTNATFSRFPIVASRTHDTDGARGILEVEVMIGEQRLHVFNNHWKSGASDPGTEPVRIGNAEVLRARLDEILRADPRADVILAGDFNSQYNQKQRYPDLPRTAINDVLGSQGDEAAVASLRGPALYKLWFELPHEDRRSDEFRGEWGTLMQLLITRGLYDDRGVQYVDNSFTVAAFAGLNAATTTGRPLRWRSVEGGSGYSDHFPIVARFRGAPLRPVELVNPSRTADGPATAVPVVLPLESAVELAPWPRGREFRVVENLGKVFRVRGRVTSSQPLRVRVEGPGIEINVWIHDRAQREKFIAVHDVGETVSFVGELGQYRGEWQFVIPGSTLD